MLGTGRVPVLNRLLASARGVLELDGSCRMNTPGTSMGNWRWRMLPGKADSELASKLRLYTETFRRVELPPEESVETEEPEKKENELS